MPEEFEGGPSEPVGGVPRALTDLAPEALLEELNTLPPTPIRQPEFAQRYPVPLEEFE